MSLETECFSEYSLASIRIMASGVSNMNVASVLASSVLPVPLGPQRRNDAIGRFSFPRPERESRIWKEEKTQSAARYGERKREREDEGR